MPDDDEPLGYGSLQNSRRLSDHEELGSENDDGEGSPETGRAGKGRKGSNNNAGVSAQARRDQNRIAQREFRLRKQQQIKDLQARVELLSGDRDERQEAISLLVKNLLTENAQLRKMVKDLSGFIGEGLATFLPRLGLSHEQLDAFVNRPETAPAHEAMDSLRIARQKEESGIHKTAKDSNFDDILGIATRDASPSEPPQRKRTGPEVVHDSEPAKRARMDDNQSSSRLPRYNDYPLHGGSNDEEAGRRPAPNLNSESSRVEPNYGVRVGGPSNEHSLATQSQSRSEGTPLRSPDVPASTGQAFMLPEGRAQEAMQLIGYHLTNYRQNNAYVLPSSLRPTPLQRNLAHEHIIDGIIFPSLRDKLILLRGKYDVIEVVRGMFDEFTIPGEDTLNHHSWEVSEKWLRENIWFWDKEVLEITNSWRTRRGETILTREDLDGSKDT